MVQHIGVILTDPQKRIIWVNEDFTCITGYTLVEAVGKVPGAILQGPKTEPEVIQRIRKALQMRIPLQEKITNYRKNGEEYICNLVIHPVFGSDNELLNYIAFEVNTDSELDEALLPLLALTDKYRSSSLKGVEEIKLFERLKNLLEEEKVYLNPVLSLKGMADRLATNTKYLSQVVNHQTSYNFQQFINLYRVDEAKKKILSNTFSNLTLYGVALQCGFKNKSTFYKVFKEVTGHTPKEFIKNQDTSNKSVES